MKNINTMKFIVTFTNEVNAAIDRIKESDTYSGAQILAQYAHGLVDGMTIFTNEMICPDNSDFICEMSGVEDDWRAAIFQALGDAAIRTKQSPDVIIRMYSARDALLQH